jgi:peptidoglycan/xylan/chitin deacetylase (PgdA/CDA1 family)
VEALGWPTYLKRASLSRRIRFWVERAARANRRIGSRSGIVQLHKIIHRFLRSEAPAVVSEAGIGERHPPKNGASTDSALNQRVNGAARWRDRRVYWEALFERPDPWNYSSDYEQLKYERTLSLVPNKPVARALEVACAEGHFTMRLANRTNRLLAVDISNHALERARARCAGRANIEFQQLDLVCDPFPGTFDLIVCSEVLYYLTDVEQLSAIGIKLRNALTQKGHLLSAHAFVLKDDLGHTGFDWPNSFGAAVISRALAEASGLSLERSLVTELYRVDLFRRIDDGDKREIPTVEFVPLGSVLEPDVARMVVWGGAKARRADVLRTERRKRVPVLMYHRIAETGPRELSRYRVSPAHFAAQMQLLRRLGYHSVTSSDIREHFRSKRPFAGRPIMITFDDGYMDFRDIAWPILRACDFSAEVFVPTDMVGGQAFWDAEYGPLSRLMSWADLLALRREGVRFGSHLASHSPADGLSSVELAAEAANSRALLEQRLGDPVYSAAAPFGILDERLRRVLAICGYQVAFSTRPGVVQLEHNLLQLPRIGVQDEWDDEAFLKHIDFQWSG